MPLFPACKDPSKAIHRSVVAKWFLNAEKLAALPKVAGGVFHPYRRLWATERKHLPDVDVCAAGGWRDPKTMHQSYVQADPATVLSVVQVAS